MWRLDKETSTVTVTKDGKELEVYLRDFSKYELAGQVSPRTELHVGDRVAIHAKKNKDNMEEAYDVRFMHPQRG